MTNTTSPFSLAKITRPKLGKYYPRQRLFALLDQAQRLPVIWLSAPAGSGKTTLIASYLAERELPVLWYQMDEGDGDIASFFYYMGLAGKKAAPRKRIPLPLLTPEHMAGLPVFTRNFFRDLYRRLKSPSVLVFDNVQDVPENTPLWDLLPVILAELPEQLSVIFISRQDPPASLARMCTHGELTRLGWDDMQLSLDESRGFANMYMAQTDIADAELERFHNRLGGWAAGFVLLSEYNKREDLGTIDVPDSVGQETLFAYFAGEIFEHMEPDIQDFLLKTAFLAKIKIPMARALTGRDDAGLLLSHMVQNNYFTLCHSDKNAIYQYHPLFQTFLLARARSCFDDVTLRKIQESSLAVLLEDGQFDKAASLLSDMEDWGGLCSLIIDNAPVFILQGRLQTLMQWLQRLPEELLETMPWLLYWYAICQSMFSPTDALTRFERAIELFHDSGDDIGIFMTWSGIIDAIIIGSDDWTKMGFWIDWLETYLAKGEKYPNQEIETMVAISMVGALNSYPRQSLWGGKWVNKAELLSQASADTTIKMKYIFNALVYYIFSGDMPGAASVVEQGNIIIRSDDMPHSLVILFKSMEAMYYLQIGLPDRSRTVVVQGIEIANKSGVHAWDHMLLSKGVYVALNEDDIDRAEEYLRQLEAVLEYDKPQMLSHYHYLKGWYHLVLGNTQEAIGNANTAISLTNKAGTRFSRAIGHGLLAQALVAQQSYDAASSEIRTIHNLISGLQSPFFDFMACIVAAELAMAQKNEAEIITNLQQAMSIGSAQNYLGMFTWHSPLMARLCAKALENNIEVDYVYKLIRLRKLVPDTNPVHLTNWPWAVKIHICGRFRMLVDGEAVKFNAKAQAKPIELLKVLVALGGLEVSETELTDILWPDADGDAAHSAFTTTLSRLRGLLKHDQVLLLSNKCLSLNQHLVWSDCWALQYLAHDIEDVLKRPEPVPDHCRQLSQKLLGYNEAFLTGESTAWVMVARERLRSRWLRNLRRLGQYWQGQKDWQAVAELYQCAFDNEPMAEDICRGLMSAYHYLGQRDNAIKIYQQCSQALQQTLSMTVSAQTEDLYQRIIHD